MSDVKTELYRIGHEHGLEADRNSLFVDTMMERFPSSAKHEDYMNEWAHGDLETRRAMKNIIETKWGTMD